MLGARRLLVLSLFAALLSGCLGAPEPTPATGQAGVGTVEWASVDAPAPPEPEPAAPEAPAPIEDAKPTAEASEAPEPEVAPEPEPPAASRPPFEIVQARMEPADTAGDPALDLTLTVRAVEAPTAMRARLEGPAGVLHDAEEPAEFSSAGQDLWTATRTFHVSRYAPAGEYAVTGLAAGNANGAWTTPWMEPLTQVVEPPEAAEAPAIRGVTLRSDEANGTVLTLEVAVRSDAPLTYVTGRLAGPNGTLFEGPWATEATQRDDGTWKATARHVIPKDAPSGEYGYEGLRIVHAGGLGSPEWPFPPRVNHGSSR